MRGHEHAQAMRRQGFSPKSVFIDLGGDGEWARIWHTETPACCHVEVADDELVSGLDFRFCVGLLVIVQGADFSRAKAIAEACVEAGARRVVAADHEGNFVELATEVAK